MLQGELAYQFGRNTDSVTFQQIDHKAWAAQGIARYALDMKYNPVLMGIYSYYSGDVNDATDAPNTSRTWDAMYENQTSGHIANVLLDPGNLHVFNLRGIVTPLEDVTLTIDYVLFRFAKSLYASGDNVTLWMPDHTATSILTATGKDDVGQELDVALNYDYTEDVQLGLMGGLFFPGDAFDSKSTKIVSEVIASVKVNF